MGSGELESHREGSLQRREIAGEKARLEGNWRKLTESNQERSREEGRGKEVVGLEGTLQSRWLMRRHFKRLRYIVFSLKAI